jgi:hypothetical protein
MPSPKGLLKGWDSIEKYFPLYARGTIRKKYGAEMLERGFAFKSRTGKRRSICYVWSFEKLVLAFIAKKQEEQGEV